MSLPGRRQRTLVPRRDRARTASSASSSTIPIFAANSLRDLARQAER